MVAVARSRAFSRKSRREDDQLDMDISDDELEQDSTGQDDQLDVDISDQQLPASSASSDLQTPASSASSDLQSPASSVRYESTETSPSTENMIPAPRHFSLPIFNRDDSIALLFSRIKAWNSRGNGL